MSPGSGGDLPAGTDSTDGRQRTGSGVTLEFVELASGEYMMRFCGLIIVGAAGW